MDWPFLLPENDTIGLKQNVLFSRFILDNRNFFDLAGRNPLRLEFTERWLKELMLHWYRLRSDFRRVAEGAHILSAVLDAAIGNVVIRDDIVSELVREFRRAGEEKNNEGRVLTKITVSGNTTEVKSQMDVLKARLNKATKGRGEKAELARFMKLPLANISQWLSGKREPGGENTLRLLRWVEQQEAKRRE